MGTSHDRVSLLQITDTHCFADDDRRLQWTDAPVYPNRQLQAVLALLASNTAAHSALLVTGDLAQEETAATYQRLGRLLSEFPLPVYALPGNHDAPEIMRANLGDKVQMPSHVELGRWHLLLLRTPVEGQAYGRLDDTALQNLATDLQSIPPTHFAALFMHHHPLSVDSEWMDGMGLENKEALWDLVERFPQVRVMFNGHIHQEFEGSRLCADGRRISVYGTPATCIQVKPKARTVEFDHSKPAWRNIELLQNGSVDTCVHYLAKASQA